MSPHNRRTNRRAAATKAALKIKFWKDDAATESASQSTQVSKRNQFENQIKVPFGSSFANAANKKKASKDKKKKQGNVTKKALSKAYAKATLAATEDPAAGVYQGLSINEHAAHLQAELACQSEHEAYLQRRQARMVHSDNKMVFSLKTTYNMEKKHPDSPDYSPVKALNLSRTFRHAKLVKIVRCTRQCDTVIRFKNVY